jgi:hypothetical protein
MEINNFIKIYDSALPLSILSNFIQYIDKKINFNEATVGDNKIDFSIRRTYVKGLFKESPSMTEVHWSNFLSDVFDKSILKYKEDLNIVDLPITGVKNVDVLKYEPNGFYTWHVDHFNLNPRTMSCILLLNNDYEGGSLSFRYPDQSKEMEIPVKANRLIVWPSNFMYPHKVNTITKGIRYSVVAWAT